MTAPAVSGVAEAAALVRRRIARAGGDPARIRVVAMTKGFGAGEARAAVAAGLDDLGENFAGELLAKAAAVPGATWHFTGSIQRRAVRDLAPLVALWHGVDRVAEGESIARHRPGAAVLVEVNTSGEDAKGGCAPEAAAALVGSLRDLGLDVQGLMTIGPLGAPEAARPGFRRLAELAGELGLRELSMGMTADLEVAVEEGATMVRVGTALFGARQGAGGPGAEDVDGGVEAGGAGRAAPGDEHGRR